MIKFIKKQWKKLVTKMVREKASPEYIARGWAIGMFYGLFIPFGFQLICSIPTAYLLKGSKVGSIFGTLVTNHFTIFLIYPFQCYIGNKCIGGSLTWENAKHLLADLVKKQDFSTLAQMSWDLIISFFVGGALLALIGTPITYVAVKNLVVTTRKRMELRRQRRLEREEKQKMMAGNKPS